MEIVGSSPIVCFCPQWPNIGQPSAHRLDVIKDQMLLPWYQDVACKLFHCLNFAC